MARGPPRGAAANRGGQAPRLVGSGATSRGALPPRTNAVPRSLDTAACFEFARGKIANVLGADVSRKSTHTRPACDCRTGHSCSLTTSCQIDGEPKSMTRGRVVTDHHVHADRWYLDAGRIPTCIAVEAGQADLFLSGFLGIDFETKGAGRLPASSTPVVHVPPRAAESRRLNPVRHLHRRVREAVRQLAVPLPVRGDRQRRAVDEHEQRRRRVSSPRRRWRPGKASSTRSSTASRCRGKMPAGWRELVPVASCSLGATEVAALRGAATSPARSGRLSPRRTCGTR